MAATTAAILGLGVSAATTAMSFAQANKQRIAANKAQEAAKLAMDEARKRLDINVFDKLAIQKEPYELMRDASLSQGTQTVQALQEDTSGRGLAASAGRLQASQNQQQAEIRTAMGQELMALAEKSATEKGRLLDVGTQFDLTEAQGAQMAAADAKEAQSAAVMQGMQGIGSMAGYAAQLVPLYMQSGGSKAFDAQQNAYNKQMREGTLGPQFQGLTYRQAVGLQNPEVQKMTDSQFQEWMSKQNKSWINEFGNPSTYTFSSDWTSPYVLPPTGAGAGGGGTGN